MKRIIAIFLLALLTIITTSSLYAQKSLNKQKKNVLFIIVDDLNTELGCYGHTQIVSPNIDKLANEGVVFNEAYCQWPVCGPSRASFLTGETPDGTGIRNLKDHLRDINPTIITMPQYFKQHGYVTAAIGKVFDHRNVDEGNDSLSWSLPYKLWGTYKYPVEYGPFVDGKWHGQWRVKNKTATECGPKGVGDDGYLDGLFSEDALKKLDQMAHLGKPFFLAVGFKKPHIPFIAPRKYWELYNEDSLSLAPFQKRAENTPLYAYFHQEPKLFVGIPKNWNYNDPHLGDSILPPAYQRRLLHGYYACISYIDAQVGKILNKLKEIGLDKNTVVVLLGDNGYQIGDHNMWGKHTVFEWASQDPLIIYSPGDSSGSYEEPVDFLDLFPTLCNLTGLKTPSNAQGRSLVSILAGSRKPIQPVAVTEYRGRNHATYSFRTRRYRFTLRFDNAGMRPDQANWDSSRIIFEELYDYSKDPLETMNVAYSPKYKVVRDSLLQIAHSWWQQQRQYFLAKKKGIHREVLKITTEFGKDKRIIPKDVFGFNGKTIGGPSFTNKAFQKAVRRIYPGNLRYPAGTFGNYFDWRTGNFISGTRKQLSKTPMLLKDYISGMPSYSSLIYMVNMARPTPETGVSVDASTEFLKSKKTLNKKISDILSALDSMDAYGKFPTRIELGNEFYFHNNPAAIYADNPKLYLNQAAQIAKAIHTKFDYRHYPHYKIALIATQGGTTKREQWDHDVFNALKNNPQLAADINAVVMHWYVSSKYGPDTNPTNTKECMQFIAQAAKNVNYRTRADYNIVPEGLELWATEYGVKGNYKAGTYTWASGMRAVALALNYFGLGNKIKVLDFHYIRSDKVINKNNVLGPEGYALALLDKAALGKEHAISLDFKPNPAFLDNYPSLIGWNFWNSSSSSTLITNFSDKGFILNISDIVDLSKAVRMIQRFSKTPWQKGVTEKTGIKQIKKNIQGSSIFLPAFSVTYLGSNGPSVASGSKIFLN